MTTFKYRVVYDNGKPYEEKYNSYDELYEGLKKFYLNNKESDYPFDAKVYDKKDKDITDSYVIEHMIADIMEGEENG
jgi:hypothetical protein